MAPSVEPLTPKALERHVKRHVVSAEHAFAAVTPPELAPICLEECRRLGIEGEISEAGVEFTGGIEACYLANLALRTASRILCRLPDFRAGTREELFFKASKVRWELWLNAEIPLDVASHVLASRVDHEGMVTEAIVDGIRRRFRELGMSEPPRGVPDAPPTSGLEIERQRILVHLVNNHCRVSLDTTGPHLHLRGYRAIHAGAPLRETLAAGILLKLGWQGETPLVDAMCGSGTFGIEAALLARGLPPGLGRSFLFERWPSFQEKRWAYLRRNVVEDGPKETLPRIVGMDVDPAAAAIARANSERAGVVGDIEWMESDFFAFHPAEHGLANGLVTLNPPYGMRLEGGNAKLYEKIGTHLRDHFRGWRAAVLAPDRTLALRLGFRKSRTWNLVHGGLPILVAMAQI